MTKARNENAPAATEANSTNQKSLYKNISVTEDDAQPSDWVKWRARVQTVQQAAIQPPVLKLLLLNLAIHSNAKTGLAWPSLATLAHECSVSHSHAKRTVKTAKDAGLINIAQSSNGGGRNSTVRYRLDLDAIARGFTDEPGSPMNPVHLDTLRGFIHEPPPGSSMNPNKGRKTGEENPASPGGPFGGPASPAPVDRSLEEAQRWLA